MEEYKIEELVPAVKMVGDTSMEKAYGVSLGFALISMLVSLWIWLFTKEVMFAIGIFMFFMMAIVISALSMPKKEK